MQFVRKMVKWEIVLLTHHVQTKTTAGSDKATIHSHIPGIVTDAYRLPLLQIHTRKWTKQPTVPLLPLCMNVDTAGYTGVSCSELTNTQTCQWCALLTLSAGFASVDSFCNKRLANPAPKLKTKGMLECPKIRTTPPHRFFSIIAHKYFANARYMQGTGKATAACEGAEIS